MQRICLESLATQQLKLAAYQGGRRAAADTVVGGRERVLRQTVVAMMRGTELGEHNNPGEATVYVLRGRVRMTSNGASWIVRTGDLLKIPDARSGLQALEDSAILLTVAKLPDETSRAELLSSAASAAVSGSPDSYDDIVAVT